MEPISISTAIAAVVGYLSKVLQENKSIHDFFNDFSAATVGWLRPIFLKEDGSPKETLENLKQNPSDDLNQRDVQTTLERSARLSAKAEEYLKEMLEVIQQKNDFSTSVGNTQQVGNNSSGNIQMSDFNAGKNIKVRINQRDEKKEH